jgi:hypothetical protein
MITLLLVSDDVIRKYLKKNILFDHAYKLKIYSDQPNQH